MSAQALSPSFDEIRGILKENSQQIKELRISQKELQISQKQAQQEMKELRISQKETSEQIKELKVQISENSQQIKELKVQISENSKDFRRTRNLFETQWGRLVESLVKGKLLELLNERGIEVQQFSQRTECSYKKEDSQLKQKEFDIIAMNGNEVVAVEVKTTLTPEKVTYFTDSLKDFKRYFTHYKHLTIYGAVAYLRSESEAQLFAQRQGLFVIRATGDSASLINTKDFKPKVFA